jgi:uncharacterized protein (TIGR02001 family)
MHMHMHKMTMALCLVLFALPLAAVAQTVPADAPADDKQAQEAALVAAEAPASNWSWSVNVTSDYVYRGITQSNYDPALQGGVNYAFGDSGFYAGLWASNVDFADSDGPDIETDSYIGWATDLSDDWGFDAMLTHYAYLGSNLAYGNIDFNQLDMKLTFKEMLTLTVSYSNDYVNGDYSYKYYGLSGSHEVGAGFSLNASFGHSIFSDGNGSYDDYNIGVSRQFGPVNAALNYYDTSIDGPRSSDRFVLSFLFEG